MNDGEGNCVLGVVIYSCSGGKQLLVKPVNINKSLEEKLHLKY